ncbi:chemotaxis protein CheW [Paenibacillus sp. FSL F4-0125]|uniref:Chemotaxis protein CheW n=1 Tax=Paenibacillus odorifer TaxID=189426 RepID=A0A1R0Y002_9BACL|nr:chemotaxis protein CheW [Paenibacillus odorifer]OMD40690.1 chemotaxis protein CheW [Paenibacillus odorifer]
MKSGREQYIQFELLQEKYAIHISEIQEIIKMQEISELPNVMPYVKGVINLRGRIIPVICLRRLFGLKEEQYSKHTRIVVVNYIEETVGVVVDRVDKVTTFSDIQLSPDRLGEVNSTGFSAIGIIDDAMVGILKLDQVLVKEDENIGQL